MQKKILFSVLASIGVTMLFGCNSDTAKPTTAAEKKAFMGGPMPPDVRKKFEESQKENAQRMADMANKGRASVGAGTGK